MEIDLLKQAVLGQPHEQDAIIEEVKTLLREGSGLTSHLAGCIAMLGTDTGTDVNSQDLQDSYKSTDTCIKRLVSAYQSKQQAEMDFMISIIKTEVQTGRVPASKVYKQLCNHDNIADDIAVILLWKLHQEGVCNLETYITMNLKRKEFAHTIAGKLMKLSRQPEHKQCVNDILSECLQLGYDGAHETAAPIRQTAISMIDNYVTGLIDAILDVEDAQEAVEGDTGLFTSGSVPIAILKNCCSHLLTLIFTFKPILKVSGVIKEQHNWAYGKLPTPLTRLYKELLLPFDVDEVLSLMKQVLEQQEINWRLLLSFVSVVTVCVPQSTNTFLEFTDGLLQEGLEHCDIENTIMAMLLTRQICHQGPHVFLSYADWFQRTFSDGGKCLANSRKSFSFLINFLTDLMPYETAQHIKVHILRPPFVPAKCRQLLADYVMLAKTRLQDLKESIDVTGSAEATSVETSKVEGELQVQVASAVSSFTSTGKIPTSVMEASIFRKPYYIGQFLPCLLTPRPLPDFPDAKMKLIAALKSASKIPRTMYSSYERACRTEATKLMEGVFLDSESDDEMELSPFELLETSLQHLMDCATVSGTTGEPAKYNTIEVITVICERLETLLGTSRRNEVNDVCCITIQLDNLHIPQLNLQVTDTLLHTITKCLHTCVQGCKAGSFTWLSRLLQALGQYDVVMETLYRRMWILLVNQWSSLQLHHIESLAAILVELELLGNQGTQLPWLQVRESCTEISTHVNAGGHPHGSDGRMSFTAAVTDRILMRTREEMEFALRLTSSYLKYLFSSRDAVVNHSSACLSIIRKFAYLAPRLEPELRNHVNTDSGIHVSMATNNTCVKVIYTSEPFQELAESSPRHAYYTWIVYEFFLNQKTSGQGCCYDYQDIATSILQELVGSHIQPSSRSDRCRKCDVKPLPNSRCQLLNLLQQLTRMFVSSREAGSPWLHRQLQKCVESCTHDIHKQAAILSFFSVCVCLPAYLMYSDVPCVITQDGQDMQNVAHIINNILVEDVSDGLFLPASLTLYFLQGAMEASDKPCVHEVIYQLCNQSPVMLISILVNNKVLWHLFGQFPDGDLPHMVQLCQHLRAGSIECAQIDDAWIHAACVFSQLINSQNSEISRILNRVPTKVSAKLVDMLLLQLAYDQNLAVVERSGHIQTVTSAVSLILQHADNKVIQQMLSDTTDSRTLACCNKMCKNMKQFTALRCMVSCKKYVSGSAVTDVHVLSAMLQSYSHLVAMETNTERTEMLEDSWSATMGSICGYITSMLTSASPHLIKQINQDLLFECGPAVIEAAMMR